MLPDFFNSNDFADGDIEENIEPFKTYAIEDNKIIGIIDGLDALKQSVFFMLSTERNENLIYSDDYGVEIADRIGEPFDLAKAKVKETIKETLTQDDRIEDVIDFKFSKDKGKVSVSFRVISILGDFEHEGVI
ncbi:MAG: DUF2634 domain-containing protein [Anaerovoracaceae bacterium]